MILAITGGTGFVGGRLIAEALAAGHPVRALTRKPQPPRAGVSWVEGALEQPEVLVRLVTGSGAIVHVAGIVNAPDKAGFVTGNVAGTRAILAATEAAGVRRFVHVSSLAAREPGLSVYGWSKAEAEAEVARSTLAWTIVRPPAVYGPGDLEMLELFRFAERGFALLPPGGRLAVIEVGDLARLLLALAANDPGRMVLEADDGRTGGWTQGGFADAIGEAVGRRLRKFYAPRALMMLAAHGDRLVRGRRAKLTPDRAAYFSHPDWTIDPARRPAPAIWTPRVPTPEGLRATAAWYRANGLL